MGTEKVVSHDKVFDIHKAQEKKAKELGVKMGEQMNALIEEQNKSTFNIPLMLSEAFNTTGVGPCTWVIDRFVGFYLGHFIKNHWYPMALEIHKMCKKGKFTEKKPLVFNDLDNTVFYLPCKGRKVFSCTSQNTNVLFIVKQDKYHNDLLVRYYYKDYDLNPEDGYDREEVEEYKTDGVITALKNAEWLTQRYSDCLPSNRYISRPNLQWWKKRKYEGLYCGGDCRCPGHVLTYKHFIGLNLKPEVDRPLSYMPQFESMTIDLEGAHCALEEE